MTFKNTDSNSLNIISINHDYERPLIINSENSRSLPSEEEIRNLIINQKITLVIIKNTVDLDQTTETLEFLRFLRDCTSFGIRIKWKTIISPNIPLENLFHLYPPSYAFQVSEETHERWKKTFEYGNLYFRKGPDFMTIKDKRISKSPLNFTIGDKTIQRTISKIITPTGNLALVDSELAAVSLLEEHKLVMTHENTSMFLPYRIRNWKSAY